MWGLVFHTGSQDACAASAARLNTLLVDCGRKAATRPGKGFSCMPSQEDPGTSVLGTVGSAKDCKGLGKFLTKALKKIERKPVVKFVCQEYQSTGFMRVYVKSKRTCVEHMGKVNALMKLYTDGSFPKCTYTAPKKVPSTVLR